MAHEKELKPQEQLAREFSVSDTNINRRLRHAPAGRDITLQVVAAILPVVSSGVGVHRRGKGTQVRPAKSDAAVGSDESQGDVVDVRVDLGRYATGALEADDIETIGTRGVKGGRIARSL